MAEGTTASTCRSGSSGLSRRERERPRSHTDSTDRSSIEKSNVNVVTLRGGLHGDNNQQNDLDIADIGTQGIVNLQNNDESKMQWIQTVTSQSKDKSEAIASVDETVSKREIGKDFVNVSETGESPNTNGAHGSELERVVTDGYVDKSIDKSAGCGETVSGSEEPPKLNDEENADVSRLEEATASERPDDQTNDVSDLKKFGGGQPESRRCDPSRSVVVTGKSPLVPVADETSFDLSTSEFVRPSQTVKLSMFFNVVQIHSLPHHMEEWSGVLYPSDDSDYQPLSGSFPLLFH